MMNREIQRSRRAFKKKKKQGKEMDKTGGETHKYDREKQKLSLENQKRFPNEKQAVNESCKFQSERKIYIKLYIHARSSRQTE